MSPEICTTELTEEQLDLAVSEYASLEFWNQALAREGLSLIGGFIWRKPRKLPPMKRKPPERPSKPMKFFAEQQLRRERLGESIGPVWGEARPFGARRVRLKSKGFKLSEKRDLLRLGYDRYILCEQPPTIEGPDGDYLVQGDRRKHACADMDSDNQQHPATSGSVFPSIPVPRAPYRATGQEAFERRLSEHEAKLGLEQMRIPTAAMQRAVWECAVLGRRPSDVIEGRELELNLETLKSHSYRLRRSVRGPNPVKSRLTPREPIAFKVLVIDGKEHTVSVYPPVKRNTRFARRSR
jgi:hypothetical protein